VCTVRRDWCYGVVSASTVLQISQRTKAVVLEFEQPRRIIEGFERSGELGGCEFDYKITFLSRRTLSAPSMFSRPTPRIAVTILI